MATKNISSDKGKEDKEIYTSDKTQKMVEELHDIAQDLDEISENVEIIETSSKINMKPQTLTIAPKEETVKTEIKPVEKPVGQVITPVIEVKENPVEKKSSESTDQKTTDPVAKDSPKPAEDKPSSSDTKPSEENKTIEAKPEQVTSETKPTEPTATQAQSPVVATETIPPTINPEVKEKKFNPFGFLKNKKESVKSLDPVSEQKKSKLPKPVKIVLIILGVILGLIIVFNLVTFLLSKPIISNAQKAVNSGKEAYSFLKTQNLPQASQKLAETKTYLLSAESAYKKLAYLSFLPVINKYYKDGQAGIIAGINGIEAAEIGITAVAPYADVLGFAGEGSFTGGTAENRIALIVETLDKVTPQLDQVAAKINLVDENLKEINPNDYPVEFRKIKIRENILQLEAMVDEASVTLLEAKPLVDNLAKILGYPDIKKYLIIFQNDGELRPTGGFMSAFAIMKVEKGKVTAELSSDIYSLDNNFKKTIKPPEPIAKYLNEQKWHLRNMNFSPDFKISMDTFKENYDSLSNSEKIDGIVVIDTVVLENMVKILGPLEVPGWGTFTVENDTRCNLPQIICELEHIIDRPLATIVGDRKADIMGPMMKALMDKSLGGDTQQLSLMVPLMLNLLDQKHILVYFTDPNIETAAEKFNIAGRIVDYDGDYLHINNANLGGAKSNFYIDELVEQEIEVAGDGSVQKKLTLTYTHNEAMDNCNLEAGELCLSGIQRDYFRVYVPKGSTLVEGLGSMVDIKTGEDLEKTFFEGFFELRPESKAKIILTYKIPYKPVDGVYKMLIQKQAGTKDSKHTLTFGNIYEEFVLNKDLEKIYK